MMTFPVFLVTMILIWSSRYAEPHRLATNFPCQEVKINLTDHYDGDSAIWTFYFNYQIPTSNEIFRKRSSATLRISLQLLDCCNDTEVDSLNRTASLFAAGSTNRFYYSGPFYFSMNSSEDYEGDSIVRFDHVYSGYYSLKVFWCESRSDCSDCIYQKDMGVVRTNLTNIDLTKMNIGIKTTLSAFGGVEVEFAVNYNNQSNEFIPFEQYEVSLIASDSQEQIHRTVTNQMKVEFRPCWNELTSDNTTAQPNEHLIHCSNITAGKYIIRVDPMDSRCNFPVQVVASIRRPCRRYVVRNITSIPVSGRPRRGEVVELEGINSNKSLPLVNMDIESIQTTISTCPKLYCLWEKFCLCLKI